MTIGDEVRKIKKQSLWSEIQNLKRAVGTIRSNDGDSSEEDQDVRAYRMVIEQKEKEYENL